MSTTKSAHDELREAVMAKLARNRDGKSIAQLDMNDRANYATDTDDVLHIVWEAIGNLKWAYMEMGERPMLDGSTIDALFGKEPK